MPLGYTHSQATTSMDFYGQKGNGKCPKEGQEPGKVADGAVAGGEAECRTPKVEGLSKCRGEIRGPL